MQRSEYLVGAVTPAVLAATYQIQGVKVSGSENNKAAVGNPWLRYLYLDDYYLVFNMNVGNP